MNLRLSFFLTLLPVFLLSCARLPIRNEESALKKTSPPLLTDDLPLDSLITAIGSQIQYLEHQGSVRTFRFGKDVFTQADYLEGLKKLIVFREQSKSNTEFYEKVKTSFDFYEVYGQATWGQVLITSYYEPVIFGSKHKTDFFDTPLYRSPDDLLNLNLKPFDSKYDPDRILRARITGNDILPYYSRREIDEGFALRGKKLEICWVNPVDAYFMQIQGSGTVQFEDGTSFNLVYANKNGHRFISDVMYEKILAQLPKGTNLSVPEHERFLKSLDRKELQIYLNTNPSYVFFKVSSERAITFLGLPATAGRTIATDEKYFPKGAIAFLEFKKPNLEEPTKEISTSRFVLDQDVGGVIKGTGRVDLFLGRGNEMKPELFKGEGRLYYLAPKRNF